MIKNLNENTALKFKTLSAEEKKARGILGRLYGPVASFKFPTRNERFYSSELWEKLFNSTLIKERFKNGGIFGELNHPQDRSEVDLERIAVVMPEPPVKDSNGNLQAYLDIVDTPCGKIAYQLAKYGYKFGISSRGEGDTTTNYDGSESVDPETYTLSAFDLVEIPAVESARLSFTESLDTKKYNKTLRQSLQESLNKASDHDKKIMVETLTEMGISVDEIKKTVTESYYVEFWLNDTTIEHIVSETKNRKSIQHELDNMYGKGATEITSIEKLDESMSKVYPMCEIDKEQTYTFDEHADSLDDIEDKVDDGLGDEIEVEFVEDGSSISEENIEESLNLSEDTYNKFEIKSTNAANKEVINTYTAKSAAEAQKMFDDDNKENGLKFKSIKQINDNDILNEDMSDGKYHCESYYDLEFRGLEDSTYFDDIDDAMNWAWEKVQQNCVRITNTENGKFVELCDLPMEDIDDPSEWMNDACKTLEEAVAVNTELTNKDDDKEILLEIGEEHIDLDEPINTNDTPIESIDCVTSSANTVMASYQNANKWLDITKEFVYKDLGCVFFSSFIHELAHTMPGRFDKFGDILHTINMKVPYPETPYIPSEPTDINSTFKTIFMCLDNIKDALYDFIKCTDEKYHGMACSAEECLNDIEGEYPMLYRLEQQWESCNGDLATFDKYVGQYSEHKDDLLESLSTSNLLESLKTATPYMLRNDGRLIEVSPMHPYIKMVYEDSDEKCLDKLIKDEDWNTSLQWFYDNTQYEDVKGEIKSFVKSLVDCEDFKYTDDDIKSIVDFDYSNASSVKSKKEVLSLYRELNDAMNQEFCKVRTSNMRFGGDSGDIFFRISSVDFNWFDIIWDFVEKNKNFIESVTICKDTQAFGGKVQFVKGGKNEFNNMPVDEFLTLEGKPVVENYVYKTEVLNNAHNKLSDGESLLEAFSGIHPVYSNEYYNQMKECYVNHSFNRVFNEKYINKPIKEDAKLNAVKKDENLNKSDLFEAPDKKNKAFTIMFFHGEDTYTGIINAIDEKDARNKFNKYCPSCTIDRIKKGMLGFEYPYISSEFEYDMGWREDNMNEEAGFTRGPVSDKYDYIESEFKNSDVEFEFIPEENAYEIKSNNFSKADDIVCSIVGDKYSTDRKLNIIYLDENLNINEVNESTAVDNNEALVEELQSSLERIAGLENKIAKLQEQLSVCYAKESKMNLDIAKYKNSVAKLSENTKKQEALTNKINVLSEKLEKTSVENLNKDNQINARDKKIQNLEEKLKLTAERRSSLDESISSKDKQLKSLTESLKSVKEDLAKAKKENEVISNKSQEEIKSLNESIAELNKDNQLIKNEYSQKVEKATKLIEKYKKVANTAVDKYIESAAIRLGVESSEIKNKLPESYSFNDIDDVCEKLQDYNLNISKLPFRTLQENIKVQAIPSKNEKLMPAINLEDEIDDDLIKLAGL